MMYFAKTLDSLCIGMSIDIAAEVYGMLITIISRCAAEKAVIRSVEPYTSLPYLEHFYISILQDMADPVIRCDNGVFRDLYARTFCVSLIDMDQFDFVIMAVCFDFFIQ